MYTSEKVEIEKHFLYKMVFFCGLAAAFNMSSLFARGNNRVSYYRYILKCGLPAAGINLFSRESGERFLRGHSPA